MFSGWNVDLVEKVLVHPAVVALQTLGAEPKIFVEVERDDPRQIEPFFAVHADDFAIDAHRRAAGRQAQHGVLALGIAFADHRGDQLSHVPSQILMRVKDHARQFRAGEGCGGGSRRIACGCATACAGSSRFGGRMGVRTWRSRSISSHWSRRSGHRRCFSVRVAVGQRCVSSTTWPRKAGEELPHCPISHEPNR